MKCQTCHFRQYEITCVLLDVCLISGFNMDTAIERIVRPNNCPIHNYEDYDPPEDESQAKAYNIAFGEGFRGEPYDDTKYPGSGHERDTTPDDELTQAYYSGHFDGESRKEELQ